MLKNLPKAQLFPALLIRLILDGVAGLRFLLQGKPKHLWAILEAHFYFYSHIFKFLGKREGIQSKKYYKINSIVYRYFLKNGKVFDVNF